MECWSVKQRVSAYLDDAVSAEEGRLLEHHLGACRECTLETERYIDLREKLRSLPRAVPPPDLTTRLRVAASKVRMEATGRASRWNRWLDRLELSLRHLMRPLALPAVGGLCSAVFLFSTLVPMFKSAFPMGTLAGDVPTMLVTEPMLKDTAPVAFADGDAVVDLQLDDQGRIINYSIVSAPGQQSETVRHSIENSLLFTEFWPATSFGRPVAGTIRFFFSRNNSRVEVRG
jgi:anti-sigma factor RsiW